MWMLILFPQLISVNLIDLKAGENNLTTKRYMSVCCSFAFWSFLKTSYCFFLLWVVYINDVKLYNYNRFQVWIEFLFRDINILYMYIWLMRLRVFIYLNFLFDKCYSLRLSVVKVVFIYLDHVPVMFWLGAIVIPLLRFSSWLEYHTMITKLAKTNSWYKIEVYHLTFNKIITFVLDDSLIGTEIFFFVLHMN